MQKKRAAGRRKAGPIRLVFLAGFMGAGKSTVGRALGQRLNWVFEDLDDRIERREGKTVPEIFRASGEVAFRRAERKALESVLKEMCEKDSEVRRIVALGGGAFVQPGNAAKLNAAGVPTVFLDAPVEELWRRCKRQAGEAATERPLLGSLEKFCRLYEERHLAYSKAFLTVDTCDRSIESIADEIAAALNLQAMPLRVARSRPGGRSIE